ncbi:MAG: cupin domain-containing protein [Anaerolineae bacterium]
MRGYTGPVIMDAMRNEDFRRVLYTAEGGQLVLMSLPPLEEIGMEVHGDVDQFFWIVQGRARAVLNGEETVVSESEVLIVPRGTKNNIINASSDSALKLFTVYTPPNHPDGTVHHTKAEAEEAEEHEHH